MAADYPSGLTSKALMGQGQDNISSTINQAGGINGSVTTVTLTSATAFPTSGYIQIDTETMKYTGKSSNDLTGLTRGLFGTAAAAHANGVTVELSNSAGYIDELQEEVIALQTKLGVDGSAVTTTIDYLAKTSNAANQEAFIAPTLLNSWANYGSGYAVAGYMKDTSGLVHLKGLIRAGTIGQAAFTLPSGYRPSEIHQFIIEANSQWGYVQINTVGNVIISATWNGNSTDISLSGITFRAA